MKIFISHSSKDKAYGEALVELLTGLGVHPDDIIFTSNIDYGIDDGENIFDWLKTQLEEKPYVFYLLSPNYYESVACLNEMGAAWIIGNKQTMIFTPEFDLEDKRFLNGALDPRKIGVFLDKEDSINRFIETLKKDFNITSKPNVKNKKVRVFLAEITKIKKATPPTTKEPEQKETVGVPAAVTPNKEVLDEDEMTLDKIVYSVQTLPPFKQEGAALEGHLEIMCFTPSNEDKEVEMFKQLWQLVFNNEDERSEDLRWARYEILDFLFNRNKKRCTALIGADLKYFNTVSDLDQCLHYLIKFLAYNADLYPKFERVAGAFISNFADYNFEGFIYAWFLSESYPVHLNMIQAGLDGMYYDYIDSNYLKFLIKVGLDKGYKNEVTEFLLSWVNILTQHDEPFVGFYNILKPNLYIFNEDQLRSIFMRLSSCAQKNDIRDTSEEIIELQDYFRKKFPNSETIKLFY